MTLAAAIQRVEARTDIPHARRRTWLHALHLYGRLDGRASQIIRLDTAQSIDVMARASPLALGVTKTTLRNARYVFKSVLRELGILASARPRRATIDSPEWRRLVAAVSTSHHPHRLVAFMGFCDATSVRPDEVTSETLESYLVERIATRGGKNVRANVAEVARLWNRYGSSVPGWL